MKHYLHMAPVLAVLILVAQQVSAQDKLVASTSSVIVREMTQVRLQLAEDVNSKTAKPGAPVELLLVGDLKAENVIVAKSGSRAIGTVVYSKRPNFWGDPGELNVHITFLKALNTKVPLRGASGDAGTRYVVIRGSEAKLKRGTEVIAYVDQDTEIPLNR